MNLPPPPVLRRSTSSFVAPNRKDLGPLGFGILPSTKARLREAFMKKYLTGLYKEQLSKFTEGPVCWSAVSHTGADATSSSMNVAMPDFSCEYWCTYVSYDNAPVFAFTFPSWAVYAALTLYDSGGLPIASVNAREASELPDAPDFIRRSDGSCAINLLSNVSYKGPLCVLFRLYRPLSVKICPPSDMPAVYYIDRNEAPNFDLSTLKSLSPVPPADRELSRANGKEIGSSFTALISKYLKPLSTRHHGTQFFLPASVGGLFPNANATYVIAFKAKHAKCMRVEGTVPTESSFRCYYGVMAVEYESTETTSSLSFEQMGGWGKAFVVYVCHEEKDAREAGFKGKEGEHVLSWNGKGGTCGVVLRYLHYFDEEAEGERNALQGLEGRKGVEGTVEGLAKVSYY